MSHTWVLVADSSCAKIFKSDGRDVFYEIADLVHLESKLHEQNITSDLPGRHVVKDGSRHGFQKQTGIKEHEAEVFAREISEHLEAGRNNEQFNKLIVIAAPAFLGILRKILTPNMSKLITLEINKDLVKFNTLEIKKHLDDSLL